MIDLEYLAQHAESLLWFSKLDLDLVVVIWACVVI